MIITKHLCFSGEKGWNHENTPKNDFLKLKFKVKYKYFLKLKKNIFVILLNKKFALGHLLKKKIDIDKKKIVKSFCTSL